MNDTFSSSFAQHVLDRPKLQHAAVRVGLWLAAVADRHGGFPVVMNYTNFLHGLDLDNGDSVPGVAIRNETIHKSLDSLIEEGLLKVEKMTPNDPQRAPKKFTLLLD